MDTFCRISISYISRIKWHFKILFKAISLVALQKTFSFMAAKRSNIYTGANSKESESSYFEDKTTTVGVMTIKRRTPTNRNNKNTSARFGSPHDQRALSIFHNSWMINGVC